MMVAVASDVCYAPLWCVLADVDLILNNAAVGSQVAVEYAAAMRRPSSRDCSTLTSELAHADAVVVGAGLFGILSECVFVLSVLHPCQISVSFAVSCLQSLRMSLEYQHNLC